MSSKRDLVEAHGYNRRRLVTAFVSGAPGGREVEPLRHGRALVGGVVLAAMVVAGAAVGGLIRPQLPNGWRHGSMVIDRDTGARFATIGNQLRPVANTASARLLLADDTGEMNVYTVPHDKVLESKIGTAIGIVGAPDSLPDTSTLIQNHWTACANTEGGLKVRASTRPGARAVPAAGFVAHASADPTDYLIVGHTRYALPDSQKDGQARTNLFVELELPNRPAELVGAWVNLTTSGEPVEPFTVPSQGDRIRTGVPGVDRVGTSVISGGRYYLVVAQAGKPKLWSISDFAYHVYRAGDRPEQQKDAITVRPGRLGRLTTDASTPPSLQKIMQSWPTQKPDMLPEDTNPCLLMTGRGTVKNATLAESTTPAAQPDGSDRSGEMESGYGAVVRQPGDTESGAATLVDSTGTGYAVVSGKDVDRLGYGRLRLPVVNDDWLSAYGFGQPLGKRYASRLVTAQGQG